MVSITQLNIYPVKSLKGISLDNVELTPQGLRYDRHWMLTNENGQFLTQRELPKLPTLITSINESELIISSHIGQFSIPLEKSFIGEQSEKLMVHKDTCFGFDEGEAVSKWLTKSLAQFYKGSIRLKRFDNSYSRLVEPDIVKENATTFFADGYPILVCNTQTLAKVNQTLLKNNASPVTMTNFRPNIVVDGLNAFEEDFVNELTSEANDMVLRLKKPCQRCKMTTVNPETGEIKDPKEPLKTLIELNHFDNRKGAFFGQNAIVVEGVGTKLSLGQKLNCSNQ